jgi:hypothetical protein
VILTQLAKNLTHRLSLPPLDLGVEIEERPPQHLCRAAPDRGFSDSRKTHQNQVGR